MKTASYENKKIIPWNFDYARKKRLHIKTGINILPVEVADKYPQYFRKIEDIVEKLEEEIDEIVPEIQEEVKEEMELITELESEKIQEDMEKEELQVVMEPNNELTLVELFEKDLADGKVKETKKFWTWNNKRFSKDSFEMAEDKNQFLMEVVN